MAVTPRTIRMLTLSCEHGREAMHWPQSTDRRDVEKELTGRYETRVLHPWYSCGARVTVTEVPVAYE